MQIRYELTEKDFIEAYATHRNGQVIRKWSYRIFISFVGLMAVIVVLTFLVTRDPEAAKNLVPLLVLLAFWIVALWLIPRWSMRRQFLRQPGAQGPRAVTLDSTGAHWQWSGGTSDIEWKNYVRSLEGKNQTLFYTSPVCFNIVPKRATPAEQISELRDLLTQHISSAK